MTDQANALVPTEQVLAKSVHDAVETLNRAVRNATAAGLKVLVDTRSYHSVGEGTFQVVSVEIYHKL